MTLSFLVDANLPEALARLIAAKGYACVYAFDLEFGDRNDIDIWPLAAERAFVIVSKDVDFADLARRTPTGPSVVWVRLRNARDQPLLERFDRDIEAVCALIAAGNRLVEVA